MEVRGPLALSPEVDGLRRQFEALTDEMDALVAPLTDAEFAWQAAPDQWSVGQCIDHLNAIARTYLPVLDEGIGDAIRRSLYAQGPFRYNWIGRLHVLVARPNSWVLIRVQRSFRPPPGRSRQEVTAAFRAYQVQYVDRLRQCSGLDLARARTASPVWPWLRMPLGSAFALLIVYERLQIAHAHRVLQAQALAARR